MNQEAFIDAMLVVCASPEAATAMLDVPVEDLPLDSLDLEVLRTTLEKRLTHAIDEQLWQSAPTLKSLWEGIR